MQMIYNSNVLCLVYKWLSFLQLGYITNRSSNSYKQDQFIESSLYIEWALTAAAYINIYVVKLI